MNEHQKGAVAAFKGFAAMLKSRRTSDVQTPTELLAERGEVFTSAEPSEAARRFQKADLRHYRRRQCWKNAQRLQCDWVDPPIKYYEGVILLESGIPIEHAWNVVDGTLVDVTLRHKRRPIVGLMPDEWVYIGVEVPAEHVRAYALAHGVFGSIINDWYCKFPFMRETTEHDRVDYRF